MKWTQNSYKLCTGLVLSGFALITVVLLGHPNFAHADDPMTLQNALVSAESSGKNILVTLDHSDIFDLMDGSSIAPVLSRNFILVDLEHDSEEASALGSSNFGREDGERDIFLIDSHGRVFDHLRLTARSKGTALFPIIEKELQLKADRDRFITRLAEVEKTDSHLYGKQLDVLLNTIYGRSQSIFGYQEFVSKLSKVDPERGKIWEVVLRAEEIRTRIRAANATEANSAKRLEPASEPQPEAPAGGPRVETMVFGSSNDAGGNYLRINIVRTPPTQTNLDSGSVVNAAWAGSAQLPGTSIEAGSDGIVDTASGQVSIINGMEVLGIAGFSERNAKLLVGVLSQIGSSDGAGSVNIDHIGSFGPAAGFNVDF